MRQSCDTWSQLESTDRALESKHVRSQSLERSGLLTATCRTCDAKTFGDRETPSPSSTSEFRTGSKIVWNQESGAERSVEKSWFRWLCRVQSAKDFRGTNTGDLPYNQAASQQVTGTPGLSMLNLHFCVHFLILRACWNFFDSNGLEWLQFKTTTTVAGVKPLETTCSSGTLTSNPNVSMFIFHHFVSFDCDWEIVSTRPVLNAAVVDSALGIVGINHKILSSDWMRSRLYALSFVDHSSYWDFHATGSFRKIDNYQASFTTFVSAILWAEKLNQDLTVSLLGTFLCSRSASLNIL